MVRKRMKEEGTLLGETKRLLNESPRTHAEIFMSTGLSPQWLSQLQSGKTRDPSVNKVQRLYEYLREQPLSVFVD